MSQFVFSDPHFDSDNIIRYCDRPFKNAKDMNLRLIENYNSVVGKTDICWWLGDVMYGATKDKVRNILRQLHGKKYLILGNHDRCHSVGWWSDAGFDRVSDMPIYDAVHYIMLSHEPLPEFGNLPNIINYHGHIHTQDYDFENHQHCINVSVERTEYRPIRLINSLITTARDFTH